MYHTWFCFSPAKNNRAEALNLYKKDMPMFAMASAEYDMYNWNNKMLEMCGVKIVRQQKEQEFAGIPWKFGPKIMLEPSFCLTMKQLKDYFAGTSTEYGADCSIIFGGDALIEKKDNMIVGDGTLIARRKFNFFDHFDDESVLFEPV